MRYCFSITVITVALITAACPGLTVFQTFNDSLPPSDWNTYIGSDSNDSNYVWQSDYGYLETNLKRNNNDDGIAKIWRSIGDEIYPAGTTAGSAQECWIQFDVKCTGGTTRTTVWVGLFNSDGDTDRDPELYYAGGVALGGNSTTVRVAPQDGGSYYADSNSVRVKIHVYNSGTSYTSMDTEVYIIDSEGNVVGENPEIPVDSRQNTVFHDDSWPVAMDSFGIRNTYWDGPYSSIYYFDNIYFSTEGPRTDAVPVPFGMGCDNKIGDVTGDCKINLEDFAVMSNEWLKIGIIPTRLYE